MINTKDIVSAIIDSRHGWSVSEQFKTTFHNPTEEMFCRQNINALVYIEEIISDIINSNLLNNNRIDELREYHMKLDKHLSEAESEW
jgi:hypothetical protein